MVRIKRLILFFFLSTGFLMLTGCGQKGALVKTPKENLLIDRSYNQKTTKHPKAMNIVNEWSQ